MSQINKTVVACEMIRLELEAVAGGDPAVKLVFLDIALHRTPKLMPARLDRAIKEAEAETGTEIILGYGLCSNGVAGLKGSQGLTIARCHDCLGLLLGSTQRHLEMYRDCPATLFMHAGMIEAGFDPLSTTHNLHAPRIGLDKAIKGTKMALAPYTHLAYIENGTGANPYYKERFLENCRFWQKEPFEIASDLSYFQRLVYGPYGHPDFLSLPPGAGLEAEAFY